MRLHLFCQVIDNLGDAGVCWRLIRQLHHEHGVEACLWLDHVHTLSRIWPAVQADVPEQWVDGVLIRQWHPNTVMAMPEDVPDVVIEGFGCRLPDSWLEAMAARLPAPIWINLEYLSAEDWVADCHGLPSPHPRLPLVCHFFFPGFDSRTGGLIRESALLARRRLFQQNAGAVQQFFQKKALHRDENALTFSLFCYPHAPVEALFMCLKARSDKQYVCLVPEGVACTAVAAFLGAPAVAGAYKHEGALRVQVMPMMDQEDFDRLLWSCDLNMVRGEDSFVRAQWAARPFIWHIYPQPDQAHLPKLQAFLTRYDDMLSSEAALALRHFWMCWNGEKTPDDLPKYWDAFERFLPEMRQMAEKWSHKLAENTDLASALLRFIDKSG